MACSPEKEGEHVPEKRLPMRRIREVLRLHFEAKLNERQIAKICSIGKGTVQRYLKRIAAAGLSWPLPADLDDATLEHRIFPPPPPAAPGSRPLPDFTVIHKALKSRQNVTLQLLWAEHHQVNPDGYNIAGSASCTGTGRAISTSYCAKSTELAKRL